MFAASPQRPARAHLCGRIMASAGRAVSSVSPEGQGQSRTGSGEHALYARYDRVAPMHDRVEGMTEGLALGRWRQTM